MKQTTNFHLNKPDTTDYYNIQDSNNNMDIIDAEIKEAQDKADQAFQSASNGKVAIKTAITGVDPTVTIPTDATFNQLATSIGQIKTGIDTEDATAAAGDIIAPKTAYAKGIKITGTAANNGPTVGETINLTTQNQEYSIASGFHSGLRKIKAVITNLAAGVIKAGVTVGGIAGTFTADATATAANILSGVTAYVNGIKVTGNIPVNPGLIPNTGHIDSPAISVGPYSPDGVNRLYMRPGSAGARQCLDGDVWLTYPTPDLLPQNIVSGKKILGIPGAAVGADSIIYSSQAWVKYGMELSAGNLVTTRRYYGFDNPIALPSPALPPNGPGRGISFSSNGQYLAVATTAYPVVYKISGDTYIRIAEITNLNGPSCCVSFSPDSNYLAIGTNGAPAMYIYKRSGDTFTLLSNVLQNAPTSTQLDAYSVAWSSDSQYLVFTSTGYSPFFFLYKRLGDSFTQLTLQGAWPAQSIFSVAFSPDTNYLVFGLNSTPYRMIYKRNGDTFTYLSTNVGVNPNLSGVSVAWSPDSSYLAIGTSDTTIAVYKRSGDTFTKLTDLSLGGPLYAKSLSFSPDGTYLTAGLLYAPCFAMYKRSGDTFTKLGNPSVLPTGPCYGLGYNPVNSYFATAFDTSPYLRIYKGDILGDYSYLYTGLSDLFYTNYVNFGICKEYGTYDTLHNIVTLPIK